MRNDRLVFSVIRLKKNKIEIGSRDNGPYFDIAEEASDAAQFFLKNGVDADYHVSLDSDNHEIYGKVFLYGATNSELLTMFHLQFAGAVVE